MRWRGSQAGFSLLEVMLATIILAIVSAVIMPVIVSSTDAYASARSARSSVESASFALERIRRVVREAPPDSGTGIGITLASTTRLEFSDGYGFRLLGDTLELLTPNGAAPLARGVSALEITYLSPDGMTPATDPAQAQRIHISLIVGGVGVSTCAFPRVNMGGDA